MPPTAMIGMVLLRCCLSNLITKVAFSFSGAPLRPPVSDAYFIFDKFVRSKVVFVATTPSILCANKAWATDVTSSLVKSGDIFNARGT